MPRILTRPMFRKGGLSQTARPTYQGGGVTAIRPGYRNGGLNGIMSGITPRRGYATGPENPGFFKSIWNAINPTSGDIIQRMQKVQTAPPLMEGMMKPAPVEFRTQAEADAYIAANPEYKGKIKILGTGQTIDTELPPSSNVPGTPIVPMTPKVTNGTGDKTIQDISTPVVSDEEVMESYMKMFEKAAGTEPDEIKRSKWLELAKAGLGVAGAPGGDLLGTIAREGQKGIEGLSEIEGKESAGKRQLRIAGLSAYLKGKDPGSIGKAVKDIMAANPNLNKQEALTLALRSGTATRESTAESKTQDIATSLYEDGFVESKTKARGAATALQDSIEQGVPSTRYKKLPEDKDDRKDGAYYIDPKTGVLGRYNKSTGEIIEPGDPGFKPEKKK